MFSLLISTAVALAIVAACQAGEMNSGATVFLAILGFLGAFIAVGFVVRRRIKAVQNELQQIMTTGQQRISRRIAMAQTRPGADVRLLQRQIETEQKSIFKEALAFTERLDPFRKWSLLMGRQIATMRLQFNYQLKDFEAVDRLLATRGLRNTPMMLEPITVAMKMARQYKNGDAAAAEKTFKKRIRWFRNDRGTLLYGLMAWIFVKTGEHDKARQLLLKAKETTGDETLAINWERLANGKEKSFSNAGLGDEWYGLYLENPPTPKAQRARTKGRRPF